MSELRSQLERQRRAQRRDALRALLSGGLVLRSAAAWGNLLRHEVWLRDWLGNWPGWGLQLDRRAGYGRLLRVPGVIDATRPARDRKGRPFNRRRYVLLCLLCAALYESPGQTTLANLTASLASLAQVGGHTAFDPTRISERRALIDVLRWLEDRGVLRQRDGSDEGFLRSERGDVLYDVEDRLVAYLLSAPRAPASVEQPAAMLEESYPQTHEGRLRAIRFSVMRRLLDEPVVYFADLHETEQDWLLRSWRRVVERMEEAGLLLERRHEGVAIIDPAGGLSDLLFPSARSTGQHAALLLCHWLSALTPPHATEREIIAFLSTQAERYAKRWRQATPKELAEEALETLRALRLLQKTPTGWLALPAIARFRVKEKTVEENS